MADAEGTDSPEEDFNPLADDLPSQSCDYRNQEQPDSLEYGIIEETDSPLNSLDPSDIDKYAVTPPTNSRGLRREKERLHYQGKTRKLSYREYKEQTGRSRHNYSDPGFGQTELSSELTGFEIGGEDEEGKDTARKPPAKSKSFKTFKRPRKFDRDLKHENLNDPPDGSTSSVLLTPLGRNVLPSIKVDAPNKSMGLNSKEKGHNHKASCSGEVSNSRRKTSIPHRECPKDRVEFFNIFKMLISMGNKAKIEKEKQMSRQVSQDGGPLVNPAKDDLWSQLQAWHYNKPEDEVIMLLLEKRAKANSVLEQVIHFDYPPPSIEVGNKTEVCESIGTCDNVDVENRFMDCDSDLSGIFLNRAIIDRHKDAILTVTKLLNEVYAVERLYPTTKAVAKECPLYESEDFRNNQDTLCLWLNITKDLSHTINMMAKNLGMAYFEGLDWLLLEYRAVYTNTSTGLVCSDSCCCLRPDPVTFDVEESPSEEECVSPEAYPPNVLPHLKIGKSVHFDHTQPSSPETDFEMSRLTPGTPSSTSTPLKFENSPSITNMSRTSSEISLDDSARPLSSAYRRYVEKSLKKMGMRKLLKRLHDLMDGTLQRAKEILEKPKRPFSEVAKPSLEEECILSSSPSMNFVSVSPSLHPSPENSMHGVHVQGRRIESAGCWISKFVQMGLPSFRPSYLFLVRMSLDIVHECLKLRLEQRLEMDPSFLSIRQLIYECKEVLHGAMLVKQYYKQMVSAVMWDNEVIEERLLETDLEQFDDDMKQMMEVYFSYIRKLMSYVQTLPDASRSLKNILEEEWTFTKKICPHIRGGEAEAGKRFCFMASDLLGSIGDFLETGIDRCTMTLFNRTMSEVDDESLTGSPQQLHHSTSFSKSHEHRQAIIQTCREFKNHFYEARERAAKALGFAKMLRKDLEVAADFDITVSTEEFLSQLKSTGHTMVVAPHSSGYSMFIPNSIVDDKPLLVQLLNTTCGHDAQQLSEVRLDKGYLLLVKCDPEVRWDGGVIKVEPTAETTIALSHIEVEGLLLVVPHSSQIGTQRRLFKELVTDCVEVVNEQTSCHQAIGDSLNELKDAALELRRKVAEAIQEVDEKFSMDDLADKDELERKSLLKLYTETLQQCYNFGFDYHKEIIRLVTGDSKEKLCTGLLSFARQWMKFVEEKCEKGKGTRPRWASQGLDFLALACEPRVLLILTEQEFKDLKMTINDCITHIVGTAKQTPPVGMPGGHNMPSFRVASPDPTSQNRFYYRATSCIETSTHQKFNRSQSAKSTSSEPLPSPSPYFHRLSIDNGPRPPRERRPSYDGQTDSQDGCFQPEHCDQKDEIDFKCEGAKMHRIHNELRRLEQERQNQLCTSDVIGKVVTCKMEVDYHINVRRATFCWQRGIKVGDGRFGKVYTAVNLNTGELMAMKVIGFQPNDHKTIREIADEIRTFEGIQHDSLVRYYGVEVHRDEIMIFMEFCDGGTIEEAAKAGLSESLVRKYTRHILRAIHVLHEHGIVHRDLKGNNIFLMSDGLLKLGDFGCSAKLQSHTTMMGEFNNLVGTTAFMAPEVFNSSEESRGPGRAADIWSLGCVVIEMATGKKPWHDLDNDFQIMFKVGSGASPTIPEHLSREGKDFLALCLVHDPKLRAKASELLDDPFTKVFEEDIK